MIISISQNKITDRNSFLYNGHFEFCIFRPLGPISGNGNMFYLKERTQNYKTIGFRGSWGKGSQGGGGGVAIQAGLLDYFLCPTTTSQAENRELLLIKYRPIIMVGLWYYNQSGVTSPQGSPFLAVKMVLAFGLAFFHS